MAASASPIKFGRSHCPGVRTVAYCRWTGRGLFLFFVDVMCVLFSYEWNLLKQIPGLVLQSLLTLFFLTLAAPFFRPHNTHHTTKTEPWIHMGCAMFGMYLGHKLPQWELQLVEDINEIRESKGMPPMVGTHLWIKYRMPEADLPISAPRHRG